MKKLDENNKLENLANKKSHKFNFKKFTRNLASCYVDTAFDNISQY